MPEMDDVLPPMAPGSKRESPNGQESWEKNGKNPTAVIDTRITSTSGQVDWDSDGMNPYNWPMSKRIYHHVLPALFALVVYVRVFFR